MENQEDKLYCPKCGSSQFIADKKGFGVGKAITGAVLTGGVGLLAGFIGSGKVKITCLKCGSKWAPGDLRTTPLPKQVPSQNGNNDPGEIGCLIYLIVFVIIICFIIAIAFS